MKKFAPEGIIGGEAEAILRDVEGTAALHELWAIAARNRRLASRADRRAKLQGLASFASIFTAADFEFAIWRHPPPEPSGILNLPYCELSNEAHAFVQAAYELGWVKTFNWSRRADTPEAKELMNNPERVGEATPEQLAKLLTAYIRGDRFNEGLLEFRRRNRSADRDRQAGGSPSCTPSPTTGAGPKAAR